MPNKNKNAYGLTTFCPIINDSKHNQSYAALIRDRLQQLPLNEASPMAKVPNTYLCRFFVFDDVFYQGKPAALDHLASKYLVFTSNFHGERDAYLRGMWAAASDAIKEIWEFCVGLSVLAMRQASWITSKLARSKRRFSSTDLTTSPSPSSSKIFISNRSSPSSFTSIRERMGRRCRKPSVSSSLRRSRRTWPAPPGDPAPPLWKWKLCDT